MTIQRLQLLGATSIKSGLLPFRRCPRCGAKTESLTVDPLGRAKCYSCENTLHSRKFETVRLRRSIAVCAGCGRDVPLTPDYEAFVGYLCEKCGNYVALHYGNQRVQPSTVLNVRWNPLLQSRAVPVNRQLLFGIGRSEKDHTVLRTLQVLAKMDEPAFNFGNSREYQSALVFRRGQKGYIGYLAWTEDEDAILRQIFVLNEHRGRGFAKAVLQFWIATFAEPYGRPFGVESPNEKTLGLLVALGCASRKGDAVVIDRSRCYAFVAM